MLDASPVELIAAVALVALSIGYAIGARSATARLNAEPSNSKTLNKQEPTKDVKDNEDIAIVFDKVSTKTLNIQAIVGEINFIRVDNDYDISEYGFTEPGGDTFGYMYKKKKEE